MSKPRLSKAKQKELAWLREALFNPAEEKLPEPIADPMSAAWKFTGLRVRHSNHPQHTWFWWRGVKLYVLAVAHLNEQGIPATPAAVTELVGINCYNVVANKLRRLTREGLDRTWLARNGYRFIDPPFTRVRYGRTYAYFVTDQS